jgi:hypothetical protein
MESVREVPPSVQRGTYADVPVPVTKPDPADSIVIEFALIENEIPEPARKFLYVNAVPAEFDDKNELLALILVSPVPPLAIPATFNDLHALPSYFQVFPLSEKIWFVVGDVGKFSAINISNLGELFYYSASLL